MKIARQFGLGAVALVAMLGSAVAAFADDPAQSADENLALEQAAVDPALLEARSGTAPEATAGGADLAGMPGTANGATALDQPSFATSQGSITGGAVSSSSLQATTAGGAVSLGQ